MSTPRKITLIGCGSWGSRVARKLASMGYADRLVLLDELESAVAPLAAELDCVYSTDVEGYLSVTGTQADSVTGGHVIIATPPTQRLWIVHSVLNGYGLPPASLRVEKPLAMNSDEAALIIAGCSERGVPLTIGFTLLHHPVYASLIGDVARPVEKIYATRVGKRPKHRVDALLDTGIHVAALAAWAGCEARIIARYSDIECVRQMAISYEEGQTMYLDETTLPEYHPRFDPLAMDLSAWLDGEHRGTPEIALAAHRIIDEHYNRMVAA